ncbi:DUF4186 family protein [Klebsiella pneumoniae]|uniref:DUF4186 family protein n=1 Tax=Klebsiella pneumoniae TaxID=573 RepID=UPI003B5896FD
MVDQDRLFARLARSTFRSRFRLGGKERQYCLDKGPEVIDRHAADFIRQRLAPAAPINDGKQTPMRGHPVFIAQHATATYCAQRSARWGRWMLNAPPSFPSWRTGLANSSQRRY